MLCVGTLPFHRELGCENIKWIHLSEDMASGEAFTNMEKTLWIP